MSQVRGRSKTTAKNVAAVVNSNINAASRVVANYTTVVLGKRKSSASLRKRKSSASPGSSGKSQ